MGTDVVAPMHPTTVLEQLGYTRNEARIYLAALGVEEATVAELARRANLPRSSAQATLLGMRAKGLMQYYTRRRRRFWAAENPDRLLLALREREAMLRSMIPELKAKRREAELGRPTVRAFYGADEIRLILDDMVETGHNILGIVPWEEWRALFGDTFITEFIARRRQRMLSIRLLTPRTAFSVAMRTRDTDELRTTRFWPADTMITNSNFIYGDKIAIVTLNKTTPMGTVIEDPDVAHTMRVLFECLWNRSVA